MNIISKAIIKRLSLIVALLVLGGTPLSAMEARKSLYDNPRVLILGGVVEDIETQLEILTAAEGDMKERDIVVLVISKDTNDFEIQKALSHPEFINLDLKPYKAFMIPPDDSSFKLSLIGKDGGMKQEWNSPTSFDEIAVLIDQMPMRKREISN